MTETNVGTHMVLPRSEAEIYSQVDGLSLQNLFYVKNNSFPNCYMFTRSSRGSDNYFDTPKMIEYFKENIPADENMQYIVYSTYDLDSKEERVGFSIILNKSNIFARMENNVTESYVLYGNDDKEALGKFIEMIRQFYVAPEEEKNNLFLVAQDMSGFKLNKWHIKEVKDFDFNLQYNDDFPVANATIKDFIDEDGKSGLLILWGEKGTGKTTYIRHLISSYPNKKFVFIPSNLITMLGDPSFGNFLLSLQNSIIILEDCEAVIRSRKSNSSASAVSLLLNMGDGLMSDDLGIKFICTFNEEVTNIDEALMRKGRLACMYEFKKLTSDKVSVLLPKVVENKIAEYENKIEEAGDDVEKVNRINEKIEKLRGIFNYSNFKDMTLADIYNVEDASFIKETKKIGF
jgi:hypothetical protein